jgi:hypothetical protein
VSGGDAQRGGDEVRLLHRRSELGYTAARHEALFDEPEAVSAHEQQRITLDVQRRDRTQRLVAWKAAHVTITSALATFKASCRVDGKVTHELRLIERTCSKLDREIAR